MSEVVELHPAFAWDCPECGEGNFVRSIVAEVTPEEFEEIGIDPAERERGMWMTRPDEVSCVRCKHVFECRDMREEETE